MHDAMADRNRQGSDLGTQELHDLAERRRDVGDVGPRPGLVDEDFTLCALGDQVRMDADALDLALEPALQLVAGANREQLELDARAAGVDDEDGL